ncbi:hypothetical protein F5X98DRAFT_380529 [Xylaria grammica]|nr:hypothetical protein F5X98DRAFT_380529 [Xylaria grammica]
MAFKANRTVACAVSWSLTSGVLDSRMPRGIRRLDAKTRSVVWSLRPSGACAENVGSGGQLFARFDFGKAVA